MNTRRGVACRFCRPLVAAACAEIVLHGATAHAQIYKSSVVGTEYDFITEADPSAFERLEYVGLELREMADKRPETPELWKRGYVFHAFFRDRTRVVIVIDAAFGSPEAANAEAMRYVHPLGKLPTLMRSGLRQSLVVHQGGENFTAFSDEGLIIVYADNASKRIATHDLEETIFHESVHASLDRQHRESAGWREAQKKDAAFITNYAQRLPDREDLAESALFAYTLLHHPERIPAESAAKIRAAIPNRIAYIAKILPPGEPIFRMVEAPEPIEPGERIANPDERDAAPDEPRASDGRCLGDVRLRGILADVLSNALRIDFEISVEAGELLSLHRSDTRGEPLFQAVVAKYKVDPEKLKASILRHRHVNCEHGAVDDTAWKHEVARWTSTPADAPSDQPAR
jgi:hypothetical protein